MRSHGKLHASVIAMLAVALAGGCLFPSFDQLSAPPRSVDGGGQASDAASEASAATAEIVVKCGAATCPVRDAFCCINPLGSECMPKSQREACVFSTLAECDGNEDCPSGESCCSTNGDPDITCRGACSGIVVCTGSGQCPAGKACTRTLDGDYKGCE
jgi:hypothetical protein